MTIPANAPKNKSSFSSLAHTAHRAEQKLPWHPSVAADKAAAHRGRLPGVVGDTPLPSAKNMGVFLDGPLPEIFQVQGLIQFLALAMRVIAPVGAPACLLVLKSAQLHLHLKEHH